MIRQCAWCLRLINQRGEHISIKPVPKLYQATHGMCHTCGQNWLEQALPDETGRTLLLERLWAGQPQPLDPRRVRLTELDEVPS